MLYGVDVHPEFQAGLDIEAVRAEGFDVMAVKVSEGTDNSYLSAGSAGWLARGKACGLLTLGYHYLHPGNEVAQAHTFADALLTTGVPGMIDAEALAADGRTPTLTAAGIRAFMAAMAGFDGVHVAFLYLPHWYWQAMVSPSLAGLPALWGSSYVAGSGPAAALYSGVSPTLWQSYGDLSVLMLQFTDQAQVAGQKIDANAFLGTRAQLAALLGCVPTTATEDDPVPWRLEPTPMATGVAKPDAKSIAFEDTITLPGPAAGWRGRELAHVAFGNGGGWVQEAWWAPSGQHVVDPAKPIYCSQFDVQSWEAPAGSRALVLRYAAPAGGSVGIETQT